MLKKYEEWWALLGVLLVVAIALILLGISLNYDCCNNWWC